MGLAGRAILGLAAGLALTVLAGCGPPQATIRYTAGGPTEQVAYDSATFQIAKGGKYQVVLFRRVAPRLGTADPDFEYTFFELPERDRYGWLREDNVPVYRWVHQSGRDHLWLGATGQESMNDTENDQFLKFDFRATMEPLRGTPGGAYFLTGAIRLTDDPTVTQSLINRYGDWLLSLLGVTPPESPEPKAKPPATLTPKKSSGRQKSDKTGKKSRFDHSDRHPLD
jgi:hypothetical protein